MKTKDLIKRLQELDPSGELECCVNSKGITTIHRADAFYEGPSESFEYRRGRLVKARYITLGEKIEITTTSIENMIYENPSLEIDLSDVSTERRGALINQIKTTREKAKKLGGFV